MLVRKMKKVISIVLTIAMIISLMPNSMVHAASGWNSDSTGWWYEENGWYPVGQWYQIGGYWYYFTASGYMDYSEYRDGCWLNSDGTWNTAYSGGHWASDSTGWWYTDNSGWYPVSTWLWIDGSCYYFKASGYMATDEWIDGYYLDKSGAWIPGKVKDTPAEPTVPTEKKEEAKEDKKEDKKETPKEETVDKQSENPKEDKNETPIDNPTDNPDQSDNPDNPDQPNNPDNPDNPDNSADVEAGDEVADIPDTPQSEILPAPAKVELEVVGKNIKASWNPVEGATGYEITYNEGLSLNNNSIEVGNVTEYTLKNYTDNYIKAWVRAYKGDGNDRVYSDYVSSPRISAKAVKKTDDEIAYEILEYINAERAKYGYQPLVMDEKIKAISDIRAEEIRTEYSHTRPDGRKWSTTYNDAGIKMFGIRAENLAWGYQDAEGFYTAWYNSSGHYANFILVQARYVGISIYTDPDTGYKYAAYEVCAYYDNESFWKNEYMASQY